MLNNNPFSILAETVSPLAMQYFIIAMVLLIAVGTIVQMIHHKNIKYFFENAKKAKLSATKKLGIGEKTAIVAKTTVVDIGTTSELGFGKRRLSPCTWNVRYNIVLDIFSCFSFLLHWCR